MRSARLLLALVVIALGCAACAEDEPARASANVADAVVVANREPGGACRAIGAVEVRSGRNDLPSAEVLRAYAHERDANYVVIDTFAVYDESDELAVLTRARLFRCPLACAVTMQ